MSIIIQKKRIAAKNFNPSNKEASVHERTDTLYKQYLKIFEDFETNFNKALNQKNQRALKQALETFYKNLKNDELLITDLSKHENVLNKNSKDVFLVRRAIRIVNMLADYLVNKRNFNVKNKYVVEFMDKSSVESREITVIVVKILKVFAMINPSFAVVLSNWPMFTEVLLALTLHDNKLYFKQVLSIVEALIASNPGAITQDLYPLILEMLSGMPKKYFARFSRIIALFVLENSEKTDFRDLPVEFTENKMIKIHSLLLSTPNLLENYVVVLEFLKEIIQCLTLVTAESLHKTITYLKESKLIRDSGLNLSFLKPLFEQVQISENLMSEIFTPKFIIKFIVKKSNITEILFILSNLLASKRKIDIQDHLSQLNFFNRVINPLFSILFHPDLELENPEDANGNDSYCTNPLTTTRIQLLRIIINFCDRDSPNVHNKDLLISSEEKQVLYNQIIKPALQCHTTNLGTLSTDPDHLLSALNQMEFHPIDNSKPFFNGEMLTKNAFENVQNKGLLNRIITLLRRVPGNSSYHFWLSSCVESLLRGFHCLHQIFVAHSGLLHNLLAQIVGNQIVKANNIQISYDLVGEIVKFNKHNIIFLESLCDRFAWSPILPQRVEHNIVDSNVFLRSILLSGERFTLLHEEEKNPIKCEKLAQFNNSLTLVNSLTSGCIEWFNMLVEAVDPEIINQDNICCINTGLIMAIFAKQRGGLDNFLYSLIDESRSRSKTTLELLQNFHKTLSIWQKYYLSKTKDGFSLQYTTSIKFAYY